MKQFYFIVWAIIVVPGLCRAESEINTQVISAIKVEVSDFQGNQDQIKALARDLIFLKCGDQFNDLVLKDSITSLKLSGKFSNIFVDSQSGVQGLVLIFKLKAAHLIKKIRIKSARPLFKREIINAMTIYPGNVFNKFKLKEQSGLVRELYQREGFPNPSIKINAEQDRKDGTYLIDIRINNGKFFKLKHLEIKALAFRSTRLKMKMKTWRYSFLAGSAGRFNQAILKKDVQRLTDFYHQKQYADVEVKSTVIKNDFNVSVLIEIKEGPCYKIDIIGNNEFWKFTLKKDLVLFKTSNQNDRAIRKSIRNIKERYKRAGYPETKISLEDRFTKTGEIRKLTFKIKEGPRKMVEAVHISGNSKIGIDNLQKQILTTPPGFWSFLTGSGVLDTEMIAEDARAVKGLYLKKGFRQAVVKTQIEKKLVSFQITEGIQTLVESVTIKGLDAVSLPNAKGRLRLQKGQPFRSYLIKNDANTLAALLSESGHPHVKVEGGFELNQEQTKADLVYEVVEGPFVKMGKVHYNGNFRTEKKFLDTQLAIKTDQPFSLRAMLETQRNFHNLSIFNSVRFKTIGLREKQEKINLFVDIEEQKPYYFESELGYDTHKGGFSKVKFGDLNFWGLNKQAWSAAEWSQIGYRGELGMKEPQLLGSKIMATMELSGERCEEFNQDFGTNIYGISLAFTRENYKFITTGLSFRFELRDQFTRSSTIDEDESDPRSILVTTPSIAYDTRDSYTRPRKGVLWSLSADVSQGLNNSQDNFCKLKTDIRFYWTPLARLTLAFRSKFGRIEILGGSDKVPDDQLFFLGGTTDVRGFDENMLTYDINGDPLGGLQSFCANTEMRLELNRSFEISLFYDTGKIIQSFEDGS